MCLTWHRLYNYLIAFLNLITALHHFYYNSIICLISFNDGIVNIVYYVKEQETHKWQHDFYMLVSILRR
jgi:hypothetical protein